MALNHCVSSLYAYSLISVSVSNIIWDINSNWFLIKKKQNTCSLIFFSLQTDYNPMAWCKNQPQAMGLYQSRWIWINLDSIVYLLLVIAVYIKMFSFWDSTDCLPTYCFLFILRVVWHQPLCPVHNSSDVLVVGLTFRVYIPYMNPHAGWKRQAVRTDDWKDKSALTLACSSDVWWKQGRRDLCWCFSK
jgi:hypothetical protein